MAEVHVIVDGTASRRQQALESSTADGVWRADCNVTGCDLRRITGGTWISPTPRTSVQTAAGTGTTSLATNFELTNTSSTSYDWMADSPTDNYSTLNPLKYNPFTLVKCQSWIQQHVERKRAWNACDGPGLLHGVRIRRLRQTGFQLGLVNYDQWPWAIQPLRLSRQQSQTGNTA